MAKHLRCPMCGRNVCYSNFARKVVRHVGREIVEEVYQVLGVPDVSMREFIRSTGKTCPTSGMKEGEVRRLKVTLMALGRPVFGKPDPEFVSGVTG